MADFKKDLGRLIDDLKLVLLKNRSSLSVPDAEKLEEVISSLEALSEIEEPSLRKLVLEEVLYDLYRVLTDPGVINVIGRLIEALFN